MPYTWGLLGSIADVVGDPDKPLLPIPGTPPSLLHPPTGCSFHPRCSHVDKVPGDLCRTTLPELVPGDRGQNHVKRCHLANPGEIYTEEVLPEIAPGLIDPETGQMIPELAAVDPEDM
jgi:peptide/nickel transport system ATP-binding protein